MNAIKKLSFLLLLTMLAGVCLPIEGQVRPPGKKLYTLYPPLNVTGTAIECSVYLQWQKPQAPGGITPAGVVGYYIYRDNSLLKYIGTPDTLFYYNYNMEFGTYTYTITANYDLTSYGLPGLFGESPPAGPAIVSLNCEPPMPFHEPWDQGMFQFNNWTFIPSQGNWIINTGQGNPAPTAVFTGTPSVDNYTVTLKGEKLSGRAWVCANMFLEFDYKLTDNASGGTEKLIAEYYIDTTWHPILEISNQGSTGWIHQKVDISQVCEKIYRIGFKVAGLNSANIGNWQIDNIYVYPICKGPENLTYTRTGKVISLAWQHPPCDSLQGLSGYNVYRTDETGLPPYSKINAAPVAGNTYDDYIPVNITSGVFRYYVTAMLKELQSGSVLCEASGDTVVVDYALGIKAEENPCIRVFPQPAMDNLDITSSSLIESCELFNIMGEKVLSINGEKRTGIKVPVAALPSGIYLLKIKNASGTFVHKVTVMH